MATLNIKTQNKKGNNPKYKEDISFAALFLHNQDVISIDVFEQEEIKIIIFGEELFTGTRQELYEILSKK